MSHIQVCVCDTIVFCPTSADIPARVPCGPLGCGLLWCFKLCVLTLSITAMIFESVVETIWRLVSDGGVWACLSERRSLLVCWANTRSLWVLPPLTFCLSALTRCHTNTLSNKQAWQLGLTIAVLPGMLLTSNPPMLDWWSLTRLESEALHVGLTKLVLACSTAMATSAVLQATWPFVLRLAVSAAGGPRCIAGQHAIINGQLLSYPALCMGVEVEVKVS